MGSWKQKAAVQRVLSSMPYGDQVNVVLQRYVTKGVPLSDSRLRQAHEMALHHVRRIEAVGGRPVAGRRFFEFGAGWDLHIALILWCLGVDHQHLVDIRRFVRGDLVADVARRLSGPARMPEFARVPPPFDGRDLDGFLSGLGIEYQAPADARATGLADGSIDVVTSTNTLEHVPPGDILAILREGRRILADDGLMSFRIDYKDHFSYFDHSISAYNFLTLDESSWRRRNSSLAFQNRLRHREYVELVRAAGFDIVEVEVNAGTEEHRRLVATLPLASPYDGMPVNDLVVRDSRMVLAKAP